MASTSSPENSTSFLKVGLLTDTHVTPDPASLELVKLAFELFKEQQVELVVNCGDIADHHYPEAYRLYRQIFNAVFGDQPPLELEVYAHHDTIGSPDNETGFRDLKKELGIPNDPYDFREIKGYPFLLFPQCPSWKRYRQTMQKYQKLYPDKPLFVLDHVQAFDTCYDTNLWGVEASRTILNKFPQAVQISGHSHGTLHNELAIWQDEFTAVNVGTLQHWEGQLIGNSPEVKPNDGVLILEITPQQLKFRRFDLKRHAEYRPDQPWIVPLPFVRESAPYRLVNRQKNSEPPQFPPHSTIQCQWSHDCGDFLELNFPEAQHPDGVFLYRREIQRRNAQGRWVSWARSDIFGDFNELPENRLPRRNARLSGGYFEPGTTYQLVLTPFNFFEQGGTPLKVTVQRPQPPASRITFESGNPMEECEFDDCHGDTKPVPPDQDNFYDHREWSGRLHFPPGAWSGEAGSHFRFTIDMHTKQFDTRCWNLVLHSKSPREVACTRIQTPWGDTGIVRYVIDLVKKNADAHYDLVVSEGWPGKVKFVRVKIERFD